MNKATVILCLGLLASSHAQARDEFGRVRCDGDIPQALTGQHGSNEPIMAIEARHKDLNLQDLGSSDYGRFYAIHWKICGHEVILLESHHTNLVHDALMIPPHPTATPLSEGTCKLKGKAVPENIVALLRDGGGEDLPAVAAWKVDDKHVKFVAMSVDDLLCSRDGIPTSSPR